MWTRCKNRNIRISPGFLLLIGMLLYLDDGTGLFPWAVGAAVLHELGHIAAAMLFHGRLDALTLSAVGAELRFSYAAPLTYGKESLVALAGPATNLLAGLTALRLGAYPQAAVNLGLGLFNLLPILPLDGGRVLSNLVSEYFDPMVANRVLAVTAGVLIGLLAGFGTVFALEYANAMPLILALWLLLGAVRRENGPGRGEPGKKSSQNQK